MKINLWFVPDTRRLRRRDGVEGSSMAVDYDSFIHVVEEEAQLPHEDAERAARATLETLGERISEGEARDIAQQLPEQLRPAIIDGRDPQHFDLAEFVDRVARREGVAESVASEHARAVFAALGRSVSDDEIEDMAAQLPDSFHELLAAADRARLEQRRGAEPIEEPGARAASGEQLFDMVAERARLDRDAARRATLAALEALANRISGGQVDDVAAWLPSDVEQALARGKAKSKGAAKALTLEQFVQEIADLEGVRPDRARRHARAVFSVLREVLPRKEFGDIFDQVPDEYSVLLGPRPSS